MDKSQQNKVKIGKAASYLDVSIETLRRWGKKGKITTYRSPGGHRYFLKKDLKNLFEKRKKEEKKKAKRIKSQQEKPASPSSNTYLQSRYSQKTSTSSKINKKRSERSGQKRKKLTKFFVLLLVFFAAIDFILIGFYFLAKNNTFPLF